MNHELTQQEFEQNVRASVRHCLTETGLIPVYAGDAERFIDALEAEGYRIEPVPIPATPVPGLPVEP